jgi:DNA mismatch endonuclease (patch repair protein)
MSQIKGKDTKPELIVRKFLHSRGFRYRLHAKELQGKPDLVLPKYNTVMFVHGCFWHAHEDCKYFKIPKTRTQWWKDKLIGNRERDKKNVKKLEEIGWNVITVFGCELKNGKTEDTLISLSNELKENFHA